MNIRREIIRKAREYLGTPFVHQGRTKSGLDCIGLVVRIAHDLELSDQDYKTYSRIPNARMFQEQISKHLIRKPEPQPGDVLVFALPSYPCHTAIYTDIETIIHAVYARGKVVEHVYSFDWQRRLRSVWSIPGSEDKWLSWP